MKETIQLEDNTTNIEKNEINNNSNNKRELINNNNNNNSKEIENKKVKLIKENKIINNDDLFFNTLKENDKIQPKYIFDNGLRRVQPYYYIYETYCKGRWINQKIFDIFIKEFQDQDKEYYERAIKQGYIRVNTKVVDINYLLKNNDKIQHLIHRHEPPVLQFPKIEIIKETNDIIAINKPSSIPVHPSGRYKFNTLLNILNFEYQKQVFHPANRLDRLTSGIVLIAKDSKIASQIETLMKTGQVQKYYYALVEGEFPKEKIYCKQPIKTFSHKLGLNMVHPEGKSAETEFERVQFNGKISLIRCLPKTGRTHQIRVHLLYLGYSIIGDPLYNFKNQKEIIKENSLELISNKEFNLKNLMEKTIFQAKQRICKRKENNIGWYQCKDCQCFIPPDPILNEEFLYLFAYRYQSNYWDFQIDKLPDWANLSKDDK